MSTLEGGLQAHLDSGTTTLAWCWLIIRDDGTRLGFTDHDRDLTFGGDTFESETGLEPTELRAGSDLAVDAQDATGVLTSDRINETDIADGLWDNAEVSVWRVNWADTAQRSLRRRGSIGQIRRGRIAFTAEVRSLVHLLGQTVGRLYQAGCDADVGDARCGVDLTLPAFKGTGAVAALIDGRSFTVTGLDAFASDWFSNGKLTWTSGANSGRVVEVAVHVEGDGAVSLWLLDLPVRDIAASDGFTVTAGCDKSREMCQARFENILNFRGFPDIPGQETILRYASTGGANSGEVL